jgi:hypothetical protein
MLKKKAFKDLHKLITILRKNKNTFLIIFFLIIAGDSMLSEKKSDIITFSLIGVYVAGIWLYKLKSKIAYILCLCLLIIMFVQYLFTGTSEQTEKTAVWLYLFLTIGVVQQFRE